MFTFRRHHNHVKLIESNIKLIDGLNDIIRGGSGTGANYKKKEQAAHNNNDEGIDKEYEYCMRTSTN